MSNDERTGSLQPSISSVICGAFAALPFELQMAQTISPIIGPVRLRIGNQLTQTVRDFSTSLEMTNAIWIVSC
jgi:hypothetical protein